MVPNLIEMNRCMSKVIHKIVVATLSLFTIYCIYLHNYIRMCYILLGIPVEKIAREAPHLYLWAVYLVRHASLLLPTTVKAFQPAVKFAVTHMYHLNCG